MQFWKIAHIVHRNLLTEMFRCLDFEWFRFFLSFYWANVLVFLTFFFYIPAYQIPKYNLFFFLCWHYPHVIWNVSPSSCRLGGGRRSYPERGRKLRQWLPHPQHPRSRLQVSSSNLPETGVLMSFSSFSLQSSVLFPLPSDSPPPCPASRGRSSVASRLNLKPCAAPTASSTSWW